MKLVKNLVSSLLILSVLSSPAYAECDFSKDIEKLPDGRYAYSVDCHRHVGKMVEDLKDKDDQIAGLTKSISLKDLAIQTNEQRASLWMDTSLKLENRVNTMESMKSTNQWLYFGLGVLGTSLAVWGASKLR